MGGGGCQVTAEHFQIADPLNNKQTVQPGLSEGRAVDVSALSHTD